MGVVRSSEVGHRGDRVNKTSIAWRIALNDFSSWVHSLPEEGIPTQVVGADKIKGKIPLSLAGGVLFRNGPGLFSRGDSCFTVLDGDGFVVRVGFRYDGCVEFSGQFVRTVCLEAESAAGTSLFRGAFGTRASFKEGGARAALRNYGVPNFKNNANTSVVCHGGKTLALWEGGRPHEINPKTLATLARESSFGGAIKGWESFSAHPCIDSARGHFVNIGSSIPANMSRPFAKDNLLLWEFDEKWNMVSKQRIPLEIPYTMQHDCSLTDNYVVFLQNPLTMSMTKIVAGSGVGDACTQSPSLQHSYMYVVRRQTTNCSKMQTAKVAVFQVASALFCYHNVNAYEDDQGRVVLDALCSEEFIPLVQSSVNAHSLGEQPIAMVGNCQRRCSLIRFTTPPLNANDAGTWSHKRPRALQNTEDLLAGRDPYYSGLEMPASNPLYNGKSYRYAYALSMGDEVMGLTRGWATIVKIDTRTRQQTAWVPEQHRTLIGDPEFAPDPSRGPGEDNGWLLAHTFDPVECSSKLVIIDAQTMTLETEVTLPVPLPMGFHTTFESPALKRVSAL